YNIPYRRSVNLSNDTRLEVAQLPNTVRVKGSCGNLGQSIDLLRRRPHGFAVMTGDDPWLYTILAHGGDGGILASSHLETARFLHVYERMVANHHHGAPAACSSLELLLPLLFR